MSPLFSSPSSDTNREPCAPGTRGGPCLQASCWHPLILPQAYAAPPAPAGSTEEGRAANETHSWTLLPSVAWALQTSSHPAPTCGGGHAGATSSVPEPKRKAMLSGDTLQSKQAAPCPRRDAAADAGTNPTGRIRIPAGLQGNAPPLEQRKSHWLGVPAQPCSEGSSTWQAAAFAVSESPGMRSTRITPALPPLGLFPSLTAPSDLFQVHFHHQTLPSISSFLCLAPCLLAHQQLTNREKPISGAIPVSGASSTAGLCSQSRTTARSHPRRRAKGCGETPQK